MKKRRESTLVKNRERDMRIACRINGKRINRKRDGMSGFTASEVMMGVFVVGI